MDNDELRKLAGRNARQLDENDALRAALRAFLDWGQQQCPCQNEEPDPCPLCDATVASGSCKAVEAKFPRRILERARTALSEPTT